MASRSFLMATLAAGALACAAPAWAATSDNGAAQLSAADQQFLKTASAANEAEVQLGQLASQKADHPAVKEFGRWMESAHGTAERELTLMAQRLNLPAPAGTLTAEQTASKEKLSGLSGEHFERQYIATMVQDHQQAVQAFEKEANGGQDQMVKTYAQTLLPALKAHLSEAQDLDHMLANRSADASGTNR